ncbi:MAG: ketopantoate reductase family protein [Candidatus Omnitrophota bacterium]
MKIGVIGAGAIGALVGGYLKEKGHDVSLVGRPKNIQAIKNNGLIIEGVRGRKNIFLDADIKLNEKKDLIVLATKTQDLKEALITNADFLKDTVILTIQNGVSSDVITSLFVDKKNIVSSIVMFGSTCIEEGRVIHNFEGEWIIGLPFKEGKIENLEKIRQAAEGAFELYITQEIIGMKWTKLFINFNNCIPAILGKSMQEVFSDLDICKIAINLIREGIDIIEASGAMLVSLPKFPKERFLRLITVSEDEAAKIFSSMMVNLSKEPVYGSILQSIKRRRPSEIDYINGEIVSLADGLNLNAPLNKKIVKLVHNVENSGKFFNEKDLKEIFKEEQDEIS